MGFRSMLAGLVGTGLPAAAWATQQCPPEFGHKPEWFMALGGCVLAGFVLLGLAVPALTWRATRARRWRVRAPCLLLASIVMLAIWLGGLAVFVNGFALAC